MVSTPSMRGTPSEPNDTVRSSTSPSRTGCSCGIATRALAVMPRFDGSNRRASGRPGSRNRNTSRFTVSGNAPPRLKFAATISDGARNLGGTSNPRNSNPAPVIPNSGPAGLAPERSNVPSTVTLNGRSSDNANRFSTPSNLARTPRSNGPLGPSRNDPAISSPSIWNDGGDPGVHVSVPQPEPDTLSPGRSGSVSIAGSSTPRSPPEIVTVGRPSAIEGALISRDVPTHPFVGRPSATNSKTPPADAKRWSFRSASLPSGNPSSRSTASVRSM